MFLDKLQDYLGVYGFDRICSNTPTPTWQEDPSFALTSVRNYLQSGRDARAEHEEIVESANARGRSSPELARGLS